MTKMAPQVAVTVVCEVLPDRVDAVSRILMEIGADPPANGCIPFARLPNVHFGRLFMTRFAPPQSPSPPSPPAGAPSPSPVEGEGWGGGEGPPPQLVYMADVDGTAEEHLASLVDVAGAGLDAVFQHCAGWPTGNDRDRAARLAFLVRRQIRPAAAYVNTIGRTLQQVIEERRLRNAIEGFLDQAPHDLHDDPRRLRDAVRGFVAGQPELAPALTPVEPFGAWWRLGQGLRVAASAAAVLVLLPVLAIAALPYLVLLRLHEIGDVPSSARPDPARLAEIAAFEDRYAQNPFCAASPIKPGWFRALTVRLALRATGFAARHVYNRGSLTGVQTIHFFRLVLVRDQLMFGSTFDGSLESYMDDFVFRLARGLNAIFSSAVGYPRTSFLFFGGAEREQEFKDYVHMHELPIPVFYSAYPDLTAVNVGNNAAIRAGLSGSMSRAQAAAWLRRL